LRGAPRDYARLYGRATVSAAIILAIALVVGAVIAWFARWAIRARFESARFPCSAALAAIDDAKWNWALELAQLSLLATFFPGKWWISSIFRGTPGKGLHYKFFGPI
jgi:hypothetical protein